MGMRSRISWGRRSCTRRAPSLAAPSSMTGTGVAMATMIHIRLENRKPPRAITSRITTWLGE